MYIISKYKDYYDGVAGSVGIDKSIVYERHEQTIDLPRNESIKLNHNLPTGHFRNIKKCSKNNPAYVPIIIGFCGKLYVGFSFTWYEDLEQMQEIIWDKNEILKRIKDTMAVHSFYGGQKTINEKIAKYDKSIDELNESAKFLDVFIKYKTPIIKFNEGGWDWHAADLRQHVRSIQINVNLNNFTFYKKFDSFQCFQELSMFIGNVLTNKNEIPEIPQEYRMAQRGLDKTSFRQAAPGNKKEKRRQNKLNKRTKKL